MREIFRDKDHVELLGGILVDKMTKKDPHNFAVGELSELLRDTLKPDWVGREEKSAVLGRFCARSRTSRSPEGHAIDIATGPPGPPISPC